MAGLYARRDPVLGAALRALMPLPLVEDAVGALDAFAIAGQGTAPELRSLPAASAVGLDRGLMALAGVVDRPAPTSP